MRVVIADDAVLVRDGIAHILSARGVEKYFAQRRKGATSGAT